MSVQPTFCEVILPLSLKGTFTYHIPPEMKDWVVVGARVEVQFGKRKIYAGIVRSLHDRKPTAYAAKDILGVTDDFPIVQHSQLHFWDWMAEYYCCNLGDIMQAAMPSYFRLDSETFYVKHPDIKIDLLELPDDEYLIASALERVDKLKLEDIQLILGRKSVSKIIRSLLDKRVLFLEEYLEEKYKPKMEVYVCLNPEFHSNEQLHTVFNLLQRSPKQTDLLLAYLHLNPAKDWVLRKDLLVESKLTSNTLKSLIDRNIFISEERPVYRIGEESLHAVAPALNEFQAKALSEIEKEWIKTPVVVLQGVTASGKTHVYAELIKKTIAEGKQVLYLVPEITLTTQLIQRLKILIGHVGVYHSRFNPAERVETWFKVLQQEYNIVVGARSAIFLPFVQLGLIIVDEEHDNSYKQQDPAPRYQARDSAIVLAHQMGSKVVLGSATPSMETWVNMNTQKFAWVKLDARHGEMKMPLWHFINMSEARKAQKVTGMVSEELQLAVKQTIQEGNQVILFQNRRGYSPNITCRDCGWVAYCKNCDVSMTYHKFSDQLKCHYCGYSQPPPKSCPVCESTVLEQKGAGTERVEDDLHALFPDARLLRMDYDTAKGKYAHERIIEQFAAGEADIMIGTQMVTKGLDFKGVGLVGVLNADALLHYPDFRSMEKAFQLLTQVSGRAGRSEKEGKVMVQIGNDKHNIVNYLKSSDIEGFYQKEWSERQRFHYPPYNRLIHLSIRDKEDRVVQEAANFIFKQLNPRIQEGECLGPGIPPMSRLQGLYLREILLKVPRNPAVLKAAKQAIEEVRQLLYQYQLYKRTRILVDVDPG